MSTEPKVSEIRQIAVTVTNVETALRFYRDVLGLTFLFSAGRISPSWMPAAFA